MNRARPRIGPLVAALLLAGCAAKGKKAQDSATPTGTTAPAVDEVEARAQELGGYEAQLRALGIDPPSEAHDDVAGGEGAQPEAMTTSRDASDRCTRICAIAEAICAIETQVCDLAQDHPGEARYAEVCTRAHADCKLATSACEECSDA